jgi:hypothetical protein
VLPIWLSYLPLKIDLEEACVCNDQLCQVIAAHLCACALSNDTMARTRWLTAM